MAKVIDVKNNQVVVTDLETGECVVQPYMFKIKALYVALNYTKFGKSLGLIGFKRLHKKEDITNYYSEAGDELCCSLAKFANLLNGACYRAYISPNEVWHNRFGLTYHKDSRSHVTITRNPVIVEAVNAKIDVLNMYVADNMRHMAGFGLLFGEAHQAKKYVGKGLWKNLCKNSMSRNDLICKQLLVFPKRFLEETSRKDLIAFLNGVPSTILSRFSPESLLDYFHVSETTGVVDLLNKVIKHMGVPLCKIDPVTAASIRTTVEDSLRLNRDAFNPSWSIARILREHDEGVKRIKLEGVSPEEFGAVKILPNAIADEKFQATICKSAKEMVELGIEQHHCVGSYSLYAKHGHYAVYKIVANTGEVTTLGISNPKSDLRLPGQHYGAFNAQVLDDGRKEFANKIINKVTKIMEEYIPTSNPDIHGIRVNNHRAVVAPAYEIPF